MNNLLIILEEVARFLAVLFIVAGIATTAMIFAPAL